MHQHILEDGRVTPHVTREQDRMEPTGAGREVVFEPGDSSGIPEGGFQQKALRDGRTWLGHSVEVGTFPEGTKASIGGQG